MCRAMSCFGLGKLIEDELAWTRRALVARVAEALVRFDSAERRFLLSIKRDCFNGRKIGPARNREGWPALLGIAPTLVESIVDLERRLDENDVAFADLYRRELARERRHVVTLADDRRFFRGVALGRPGLARKIRARAPSWAPRGDVPEAYAKWEQSLLRFVVRAATKLSANSTLTAYALGSIEPSLPSGTLQLRGANVEEVSLVRLGRREIEQLSALLIRHPTVRRHCLVAWNDGVEELPDGRYRVVRDGYWSFGPGSDELHFVKPARIIARLPAARMRALETALREGPIRYDGLLDLPPRKGTTSSWDPGALEHLIKVGILQLMPPWPANEAYSEPRVLRFLRHLPEDAVLRKAADALDTLLELERSFAASPEPERTVERMETTFSTLLRTVVQRSSLKAPGTLFEDVLFAAGDAWSQGGPIFQIAAPTVKELLKSARLVSRFASLFNHRHDLLHTLAAWWRSHWPNRSHAPFLELVHEFGAYWTEFSRFEKRGKDSAVSVFNPLNTDEIEQLRELRRRLLAETDEMLRRSPGQERLSVRQLETLLRCVPDFYAPPVGSCLFAQPVDAGARLWVLNGLHEGTGRYLSRITPVLGDSQRTRLLDHLIDCSRLEIDGEDAHFLEIQHPWGSLVDAHAPQARKVLALCGTHLDVPAGGSVALDELDVVADLDTGIFRVLDRQRCRLLPVHLSSMANEGLPPLLRFLLAFGPGEPRGVFPFAQRVGSPPAWAFRRVICGNLVVRRRRWILEIADLAKELSARSGDGAYLRIQAWRRRLDLPPVGFYYERTYNAGTKPQYVDFTSPALSRLFTASLARLKESRLILEEALPSPLDFPVDTCGQRRGLEVLIDELAVSAACGIPPPATRPPRQGATSPRKEAKDA